MSALVRLSGLAERTFKRRFQPAIGVAPLEYVHTLRLEEAKQIPEASDLGIEARRRGGLRRRRLLQSAVPAQGKPHPTRVSQALWRAMQVTAIRASEWTTPWQRKVVTVGTNPGGPWTRPRHGLRLCGERARVGGWDRRLVASVGEADVLTRQRSRRPQVGRLHHPEPSERWTTRRPG